MSWVKRETERIWQETSKWRADRTHLHFGGRGGFLLTAGVIAAFGWVDIVTLERVFHLAVTPLAVLWGFQQFYPSDEGTPKSEQHDSHEPHKAWRRATERIARLSGIYAVVAILLFTALPNETVKGFFFPLVVILAALSIGSTKTRIVDNYQRDLTDNNVASTSQAISTSDPHLSTSFPRRSTMVDYILLILVLLGLQQLTRTWHSNIGADIGTLIRVIAQIPSLVVIFLFYKWMTDTKWGRGIGGVLTRTRVQSGDLDQPPSSGRAFVRAVGTVFGLILWLVTLRTVSWFGWQTFMGVMIARVFVALWFEPIQGRGVSDIISGTRVVKVVRSESV